MGPGFFVIAIFGCADGGTACTPVATLPAHYVSAEQCDVQTAAALIDNNDFDYPTLVARCRPANARELAAAERARRAAAEDRAG